MTDLAVEVQGITVTVLCEDDDSDSTIQMGRWANLLGLALAAEGVAGPAEVTLVFVDSDVMTQLNGEHMDQEGPTDVLSFPLDDVPETDDMPRMVGDVVLCLDYAHANALAVDPERILDDEVALLIVHGALHLLGHDHAEVEERSIMRAREQELLASLHRVGTHPDDVVANS